MPHPDVRLKWSASSLSTYDRDPFAFWLFKQLRVKVEQPKRALIWGHAFHDFVQEFEVARLTNPTPELIPLLQCAIKTCKEKDFDNAYVAKTEKELRSLTSLIRACTLYYDTHLDDLYSLCVLSNNKPAIEVPLLFPLPFTTNTNDKYYLEGFMDLVRVHKDNNKLTIFPRELKTTKMEASFYLQRFLRPSIQMRTYDYIVHTYAKSIGAEYVGISVCIAQLLTSSCRIYEDLIKYSPQEREWYETWLYRTLKRHEFEAEQGWLSTASMLDAPYVRIAGITHSNDPDNDQVQTHDLLMKTPKELVDWVKHVVQSSTSNSIG